MQINWLTSITTWTERIRRSRELRGHAMLQAQSRGATLSEIGEAAGMTKSGAHAAIKRAKEKRT